MRVQTNADRLDRAHLITSNRELIEAQFLELRRSGVTDVVVAVLDLRDSLARKLAAAAMGKQKAEAAVREYGAGNQVPTCVLAMTRKTAVAVLGTASPNASRGLALRENGAFPVVAIANEGISYGLHAIPAQALD